jgi:DNA invertase Pin-like site-specific DNA recombinase
MMKQPFGYGRFSNLELQDQKSITDQKHVYTKLAERIAPGHGPILHFADEGVSGADPMITRSDLQKMLRAVAAGECDGFLFIESTERLSRDPADLHTLYKLLTFHRVRIFSVEEGEVTDMVIGLKAAMNAQYLKALGQKTLRGQIGVFLRGRWPSGAPFGYRFDHSQLEQDRKTGQMLPQRGVLEIDPISAAIVVQIFEWYDAGLSGEAIAKRLTALGVDAPSSKPRRRSSGGRAPSTATGGAAQASSTTRFTSGVLPTIGNGSRRTQPMSRLRGRSHDDAPH